LADIDRVVQLNPHESGVYFFRAVISVLIESDWNRALADMDRAINLEPRASFYYAFRSYVRAKKQNCVPAFSDFVLCARTLNQSEYKFICDIDTQKSRFVVGFRWRLKDPKSDPKSNTVASDFESRCIDLSMQRLLAATFGSSR
jgi:hypothetical protein